jgi:DNA-binding transcriptional ArsR family regulator
MSARAQAAPERRSEDAMDRVFAALANRRRRDLLDHLRDHPRTTGELCAHLADLDRCTTMQHIRVLEQAGLIVVERRGRERWNHLNVLPIKDMHDRWIGEYAQAAMSLLASLEREA